jgi:hypothetical protein
MTRLPRAFGRSLAGHVLVLLAAAACVIFASSCRKEAPKQGPEPANEDEARTLEDFQQRVRDYVVIHKKIEDGLPRLPKEATPVQIDEHQRAFGQAIAAARAGAKHGDIMTPAMQALVRRHLAKVFGGKDAADLKGSVMDENPVGIEVSLNERYPDEVPLSTMPPEVLQMLPKMPEELEYRFVGRSLVIMDEHAHLIADFVPNAIPE